MDQARSITPDAAFTPRALVNRIRELSGEKRAPIGLKPILDAIHSGELRAARVANRHVVVWRDYLRWLEDSRAPIVSDPTLRERVEADVREHIRRESRGNSAARNAKPRLADEAGRGIAGAERDDPTEARDRAHA